jgi:hypothetical protein
MEEVTGVELLPITRLLQAALVLVLGVLESVVMLFREDVAQ